MISSGPHGSSQFGHANGTHSGQYSLPFFSMISSGPHGSSQFGHANGAGVSSVAGVSSGKHSWQYSNSSGPRTISFGGSTVMPQFGQLMSSLCGHSDASCPGSSQREHRAFAAGLTSARLASASLGSSSMTCVRGVSWMGLSRCASLNES